MRNVSAVSMAWIARRYLDCSEASKLRGSTPLAINRSGKTTAALRTKDAPHPSMPPATLHGPQGTSQGRRTVSRSKRRREARPPRSTASSIASNGSSPEEAEEEDGGASGTFTPLPRRYRLRSSSSRRVAGSATERRREREGGDDDARRRRVEGTERPGAVGGRARASRRDGEDDDDEPRAPRRATTAGADDVGRPRAGPPADAPSARAHAAAISIADERAARIARARGVPLGWSARAGLCARRSGAEKSHVTRHLARAARPVGTGNAGATHRRARATLPTPSRTPSRPRAMTTAASHAARATPGARASPRSRAARAPTSPLPRPAPPVGSSPAEAVGADASRSPRRLRPARTSRRRSSPPSWVSA